MKVYTWMVDVLMSGLSEFEKRAEKFLGVTHQVVGKTRARKEFFPIVDSLASGASAVAITDHDKPVAVLLSYHHYLALASKVLAEVPKHSFNPRAMIGSVSINSDLDAASSEIAREFDAAIEESAELL